MDMELWTELNQNKKEKKTVDGREYRDGFVGLC